MGQLVQSIQAISKNAPKIDTPSEGNSLIVFGIKNVLEDVKDIENLIVAQYRNSPIYLKEVAKVKFSYDIQHFQKSELALRENNASFDHPIQQITLTVSKLKGTNAVTIAKDVIEYLKTRKEDLAKLGIGYIVTRNYGIRANEAVNELNTVYCLPFGTNDQSNYAFCLFAKPWIDRR